MTYPGLILRGLAALALATPVACTINNQAFMFESDGDGSAGTSTTAPTTSGSATSFGGTDTGVDTGPSSDVTAPGTATGDPSISTSGPTSDATSDVTSAATSNGGTTADTTSTTGGIDCADPGYFDVLVAADAFFIAGSSNQGTSCGYPGGVPGGLQPSCAVRNFGTTSALPLAKTSEVEGMFAVRFNADMLQMLQNNNVQIAFAKLYLTGWGLAPSLPYLEVGMVLDTNYWAEGKANGTVAILGDSSYEAPIVGTNDQWVYHDGPRGDSEWVADINLDIPADDHYSLISEGIVLGDDYVEQLSQRGLVVSYPIDAEPDAGPGLKSRESIQEYWPFLRVFYCL